MAYIELSLEAYDNLIKAAGIRGASVARVCREQGTWEDAAAIENPAHDAAARQTDLDLPDPHGSDTEASKPDVISEYPPLPDLL